MSFGTASRVMFDLAAMLAHVLAPLARSISVSQPWDCDLVSGAEVWSDKKTYITLFQSHPLASHNPVIFCDLLLLLASYSSSLLPTQSTCSPIEDTLISYPPRSDVSGRYYLRLLSHRA